MGGRFRRCAMGALAWVCVGAVGGWSQYYEDTMEPAELGIVDVDSLRLPESAYVGNDECRLCHEAAYQTWLGTAHARSFVQLRSMMGMMMGQQWELGTQDPGRSGRCLVCHATAHDVPSAYRGPGFRMEEGVTCEKCHGPGADHVRAMEDSTAGLEGTLEIPDEQTCRGCHGPKPGHEMVPSRIRSMAKAWQRIAHPMADERPEDEMEPEELGIWYLSRSPVSPASPYVGSSACADCHEEAFRVWSGSGHARAAAALRSPMGVAMGQMVDRDVIGGPVKNGRCLSCHATAHQVPAAYRAPGFRMREGVGCERCHGPGGDHVQEAREGRAKEAGMRLPDAGTCQSCHRRKKSHAGLHRPRFSFPRAWEQIAH